MQTPVKSPWLARWFTLIIAAALAASAATWFQAWRAVAQRTPSRAEVAMPASPRVDTAAVARALGLGTAPVTAPTAPAMLDQRMRLSGVVAAGHEHGVALIAIDGKPPIPYAVGASVGEGLVLQRLLPRAAELGATRNGSPSIMLELPALTPAQSSASAAAPVGKRRRGTSAGTTDAS